MGGLQHMDGSPQPRTGPPRACCSVPTAGGVLAEGVITPPEYEAGSQWVPSHRRPGWKTRRCVLFLPLFFSLGQPPGRPDSGSARAAAEARPPDHPRTGRSTVLHGAYNDGHSQVRGVSLTTCQQHKTTPNAFSPFAHLSPKCSGSWAPWSSPKCLDSWAPATRCSSFSQVLVLLGASVSPKCSG